MPAKYQSVSTPPGSMNDSTHLRAACFCLVASLCGVLASCGGGGGSTDGTAAMPTPATLTTPATAPATTVVPVTAAVSDASCGLNGTAGIQAEIMQRVNALRAAGAVCGSTTYSAATALTWNTKLLQSAKGHSADMAQNNYFSHTSLDGRTLSQRVLAAGYSYMAVGENIAAGQTTVESVMTAWINSPGHCQNLMNPTFRDIGVACIRNDAATYRLYWTMNLGRTP
jgi:uncharacterized protein YkwD